MLDAMLRITIHDSSSELRLHLEGKLAGAWVRELNHCWKTAQSTVRERAATVDLRNVDFVDQAGELLLAEMQGDGAKLLAASPMMAHLVREITGKP